MFWRMAGLAQASPIEGILDGGDFTLEDLMDEDDLIQECKSLNSRLAALYVGARPRRERTPPDAGAAAAARWRLRRVSDRPAVGLFVLLCAAIASARACSLQWPRSTAALPAG